MGLSKRTVATAIWGDVDLHLVEAKYRGKFGRTTTSYSVIAKCADGVEIPIQQDFEPTGFKDFCRENGYIITKHYDPSKEASNDESVTTEDSETSGN